MKRKQIKETEIKNLSPKDHFYLRMNLTLGGELKDENYKFSHQKTVCVREVIDNSTGHLMEIGGGRVDIRFCKDGSVVVKDNGLGIPVVDGTTYYGKVVSSLYLATGVLQSGGNLDTEVEKYSTSQNGLGGTAVNFVSKRYDVEVYRLDENNNPTIYRLDYKEGEPVIWEKEDCLNCKCKSQKDLTLKGIRKEPDNRSSEEKKNFPTGTRVKFWLNDDMFSSDYSYDIDDLIDRLFGTSFLIKNIEINIINEHRTNEDGTYQEEHYCCKEEDGIVEYLKTIQNEQEQLFDPIKIELSTNYEEKTPKGVKNRKTELELAFNYNNKYEYNMNSFVNTIKTRHGGVHEMAFEKALTTVFNEKFRSMKEGLKQKDENPIIEDYKEGLNVILSTKIVEPQFVGQIKSELGGEEYLKAVKKSLIEELTKFVNDKKNYEVVKMICLKVLTASKNRIKAREELEIKRDKTKIENSELPTNLLDCSITHDERSELYIIEGESAKTALKEARDSKYQALLDIRGKFSNAEKKSLKTIMEKQIVRNIIKTLGCGIGKDYDISKARYKKLFIAVDSDVDGGDIACSIVTLIWNLIPDFIREGRLFKIMPPLYTIKVGKKQQIHCNTIEEKDKVIEELKAKNKSYEILRQKGLGESGAEILEETAMNPETRTIMQVVVGDEELSTEILKIAMGKDVEIRRRWIEENSLSADEISLLS